MFNLFVHHLLGEYEHLNKDCLKSYWAIIALEIVALKFEVFICSFVYFIPKCPTLDLLVMLWPFVPFAAFVRESESVWLKQTVNRKMNGKSFSAQMCLLSVCSRSACLLFFFGEVDLLILFTYKVRKLRDQSDQPKTLCFLSWTKPPSSNTHIHAEEEQST